MYEGDEAAEVTEAPVTRFVNEAFERMSKKSFGMGISVILGSLACIGLICAFLPSDFIETTVMMDVQADSPEAALEMTFTDEARMTEQSELVFVNIKNRGSLTVIKPKLDLHLEYADGALETLKLQEITVRLTPLQQYTFFESKNKPINSISLSGAISKVSGSINDISIMWKHTNNTVVAVKLLTKLLFSLMLLISTVIYTHRLFKYRKSSPTPSSWPLVTASFFISIFSLPYEEIFLVAGISNTFSLSSCLVIACFTYISLFLSRHYKSQDIGIGHEISSVILSVLMGFSYSGVSIDIEFDDMFRISTAIILFFLIVFMLFVQFRAPHDSPSSQYSLIAHITACIPVHMLILFDAVATSARDTQISLFRDCSILLVTFALCLLCWPYIDYDVLLENQISSD